MFSGLVRKIVSGASLALVTLFAVQASATGANPVKNLPRSKMLYYTFDDGPVNDGPTKNRTDRVLDVLKAHNAKGLFFINGKAVNGPLTRGTIGRMASEGHIVGSHQFEHILVPDGQDEVFTDQVVKNKTLIANLAGASNPLYFRYPYGAKKPWKEAILQQQGYADGGIAWHMDSLDWAFASGTKETNKRPEVPANLKSDYQGWVKYHTTNVGGGIMLHHDIHQLTVDNLDAEMTWMTQQGYTFGEFPRE